MDANQLQELTSVEKQKLAREIVADSFNVSDHLIQYQCEECGERSDVEGVAVIDIRDAVRHGWDAAMEYAAKITAEDIEHLSEN